MEDKFLIIGLTPEIISDDEPQRITTMLDSEAVDFMHIRHPEAPLGVMDNLIKSIPERLHPRLRIHSCFDLLDKYQLGGAHLSGRWPSCSKKARSLTKSCHRLLDLWSIGKYEYVTLSPIYGEDTKPGNVGDFNRVALRRSIRNKRVVALGGIAPDKFGELKETGFYGAGMLGYLWQKEYQRSLRQIKMFRHDGFYLQYITRGNTPDEVLQEVRQVLEGGCRWIQLRMKDADDATVEKTVRLILPLCHATNAIVLINDRVELAARIEVDGVHIGRMDMHPNEARRLLGEHKLIGCSANTIDDIIDIDRTAVADYVSLGPLRQTATKNTTAPKLGYEGLMEIFDRMHERQIDVPIAVMGGIRLDDVDNLIDYGARGITVSSDIYNASDRAVRTQAYINKLIRW